MTRKRPALLTEARKIVQQAKRHGSFRWQPVRWNGRGPTRDFTPLLLNGSRVVAVPTKRSLIILGTAEFDKTEFVGTALREQINCQAAYVDENIGFWLTRLRVDLNDRNGHAIWRITAS